MSLKIVRVFLMVLCGDVSANLLHLCEIVTGLSVKCNTISNKFIAMAEQSVCARMYCVAEFLISDTSTNG